MTPDPVPAPAGEAPPRIPYGKESRYHEASPFDRGAPYPMPTTPCHDCAVAVGELHQEGCDWEQCETCGHQRISCNCCVACRSRADTWLACAKCIELAKVGRASGAPGRDAPSDLREAATELVEFLESSGECDQCYTEVCRGASHVDGCRVGAVRAALGGLPAAPPEEPLSVAQLANILNTQGSPISAGASVGPVNERGWFIGESDLRYLIYALPRVARTALGEGSGT